MGLLFVDGIIADACVFAHTKTLMILWIVAHWKHCTDSRCAEVQLWKTSFVIRRITLLNERKSIEHKSQINTSHHNSRCRCMTSYSMQHVTTKSSPKTCPLLYALKNINFNRHVCGRSTKNSIHLDQESFIRA